jgi:GNAT superfamily N-acetyltransferase
VTEGDARHRPGIGPRGDAKHVFGVDAQSQPSLSRERDELGPPPHSVRTVRLAERGDVARLAAVLARAFHDDPLFKWMFRRERTRLARTTRYFAGRVRLLLAQNAVYTTEDGVGAALWARPNQWRDPPFVALRQLAALAPTLGRRMPAAMRGLREVEARHPEAPHWYLAVLGIDPPHQDKGVGSALLAPVLERCDEHRVPAYLETAKQENIAFYTRHGFVVSDELRLPDGPPVWLMWREPGAF